MTKEDYINLSGKEMSTKVYITTVELVNIRKQVINKGSEVKVIQKGGPYGSTMEGLVIKDALGVISDAFINHIEEKVNSMENKELIKAAEHHTKITIPSDYHSFIKGANWQAKRMYSEEEVRVLIGKALTHNDYDLCGSLVTKDMEIRTANFEVWFGQFKKKEI